MNILHISTTDYGGAGTAARRLHLGLKSIGIKSKMLVLEHTSSDSDIVQVKQQNGILNSLRKKILNKVISSEFKAYKNTRQKNCDLLSSDKSVYRISDQPPVKEADIIHLHWIAGMVDYKDFFPTIRKKPIVWTLHDMNPFTGGCHYSGGCLKYKTGCGICPQFGSKDPDDVSKKNVQRKRKLYQKHSMYVIGDSKWLADCAKESLLFKNFEIDFIHYGLPTSVYIRCNKEFSRNLFGLPHDKTIILFGADYKTERKGFGYLVQALKLLKGRVDISKITLVTFGPLQSLDALLEYSVYQLGYIRNEVLLSSLYSAADIYTIPSLEEAFGQTCLESMSCMTPVVGFNVGGVPDMIKQNKTGILAETGNVQDLAHKIEYMITHPKERQEMAENARKRVEQEHTLQLQAKRYVKLYKKILKA